MSPKQRQLADLLAQARALAGLGQYMQAGQVCRQALALNPEHFEALTVTGEILMILGDLAVSEKLLTVAAHRYPDEELPYRLLSGVQLRQGNDALAQKLAEAAFDRNASAKTYMARAAVHLYQHQNDRVVALLQEAHAKFPGDAMILRQLCAQLKYLNRNDEAEILLRQVEQAAEPDYNLLFTARMQIARVLNSAADIRKEREQLEAICDRMLEKQPKLQMGEDFNLNIFSLAYHGLPNRPMLEKISRTITTCYQGIGRNYVTPRAPRERLRIGILSTYLLHHSVGNCYNALFMALAEQPDIDLYIFNTQPRRDEALNQLLERTKAQYFELPTSYHHACELVAAQALDILIYPDIGMERFSYLMALSRLAPHQLCMTGHPETTGIAQMDFYLSSAVYEPEDAPEHYTETLLLTREIDAVYPRPEAPERWLSRQELGLPEGKRLYVVPLAIQKLHPDFDAVVAEILQRDPEGVAVFFADFGIQATTDLLKARLESHCPKEQLLFLPWQPKPAFFSILREADALLDAIHFGAGSTAYAIFAVGGPLVTWPSPFARGRFAAGCYRLMGVQEPPVAESIADYAPLAVKTATDRAYRERLRQEILANNECLYGDKGISAEFERLLRDIASGKIRRKTG